MLRDLAGTAHIPEADFVDEKYDRRFDGQPTQVLLLVSTPRSGSTMLCDLLWRNLGLVAHEYFQPHQYVPILSKRWRVEDERATDFWSRYKEQLIRHRADADGLLGCNIHASHLKNYIASGLLGELPHRVFWVYRKDRISQAVSYDIAHQTGRWSSEFSYRRKPRYKYKSINKRVTQLSRDNIVIRAFLSRYVEEWHPIAYEDLVAEPKRVVEQVAARSLSDFRGPSLKKQADEDSARFRQAFVDDLLRSEGLSERD